MPPNTAPTSAPGDIPCAGDGDGLLDGPRGAWDGEGGADGVLIELGLGLGVASGVGSGGTPVWHTFVGSSIAKKDVPLPQCSDAVRRHWLPWEDVPSATI